jgi:hypothetical protein
MDTNLPTLTRRGVLALAREELGLPLSKAKLDKLCMDRRGPPPLGMFSGKHIYDRAAAIEWLRSMIRPLEQQRAK